MEVEIELYPGYANNNNKNTILISPKGTVNLIGFEDDVIRVRGTLNGLEPNCIQCGIHIHKGVLSCNNNQEEKDDTNNNSTTKQDDDKDTQMMIVKSNNNKNDHWYDKTTQMMKDPWEAQRATYTTDAKGH